MPTLVPKFFGQVTDMPNRQSFGRRQAPDQARAATHPQTRDTSNFTAVQEHAPTVGPSNGWSTTDPELEARKQARKSPWVRLPWRRLSWVASLCFGIASLALPADVNSAINWVLYALMAASFIAGIRTRRARKAEARTVAEQSIRSDSRSYAVTSEHAGMTGIVKPRPD